MDWVGFRWVVLGWVGFVLGWIGLGLGLCWVGGWVGLGWVGLGGWVGGWVVAPPPPPVPAGAAARHRRHREVGRPVVGESDAQRRLREIRDRMRARSLPLQASQRRQDAFGIGTD